MAGQGVQPLAKSSCKPLESAGFAACGMFSLDYVCVPSIVLQLITAGR